MRDEDHGAFKVLQGIHQHFLGRKIQVIGRFVEHQEVRRVVEGAERVVSIVGTDEVDLNRNHISWVSPLGRALMKSAAADSVVLQVPSGTEYLTVLEVCYQRISVEPFREPPGSGASANGPTR